MSKTFEAIRGMPDILPKDTPLWHQFEQQWHQLVLAYGYQEIRLPILENTGLFKRSIGEVTDIVEKEMFSFLSRDGKESLSLRPEGTAGCVRAGIEHGLLYHQIQRLWYMGPMFRYERPQKGRYRQFHQVGIEAYGMEGPDIEVEHILMMARLWKELKIQSAITLRVNSLGTLESRQQYRQRLVEYLSKYQNDLDEDSQRRLTSNPLRILDSKNPALAEIILQAPKLQDHLDLDSKIHFDGFLQALSDLNVPYVIDPVLVRGLDYYNRTVYEWQTDQLGAQGTLCAGGRYDGLVQQLGGSKTPAVGFAVGIERVLLLQQTLGIKQHKNIDAYLVYMGEVPEKQAFKVAEELRDLYPTLALVVHCGGGNIKHQFKAADKSGASIAFILGEEELSKELLGVKFLRESKQQVSLSRREMEPFLNGLLAR